MLRTSLLKQFGPLEDTGASSINNLFSRVGRGDYVDNLIQKNWSERGVSICVNVTGTDCLLQKRIENLYFYCIKCFFHGSKETQLVGKMSNF